MRRLRGYPVSGELIGSLLRVGTRTISVDSVVPKSAKFHYAFADESRNAFIVVMEDESFDPVAEAALIPIKAARSTVKEHKEETDDSTSVDKE